MLIAIAAATCIWPCRAVNFSPIESSSHCPSQSGLHFFPPMRTLRWLAQWSHKLIHRFPLVAWAKKSFWSEQGNLSVGLDPANN